MNRFILQFSTLFLVTFFINHAVAQESSQSNEENWVPNNGKSALKARVIESLDPSDRVSKCCYRGPFFDIGSRFAVLQPITKAITVASGTGTVGRTYLSGDKDSKLFKLSDDHDPEFVKSTLYLIAIVIIVIGLIPLLHLSNEGKSMTLKTRLMTVLISILILPIGIFFAYWGWVEKTHYATLWIDNVGEFPIGVYVGDELRVQLPPESHCKFTVRLDDLFKFKRTVGEVEIILELESEDDSKQVEHLLLKSRNIYLYNINGLNSYSLKRISYG